MPATVFVVEDDDAIRTVVREALEDEGYTVCVAGDGRPVVDRLRTSPVGMLVLLDLQMPHVDGIKVLEAVCQDVALISRHAFVIMTAYSGRTLPLPLIKIFEAHEIPIVRKPFDLNDLLNVVQRAEQKLVASQIHTWTRRSRGS
jgi:CheY-like chemotaxis protein